MAFHTFYSRPLEVHFRAKWMSRTTIFYVLCVTFNVFIPLFFVYNSDGLWRKVEFFREQPNVNFKHNLIAVLQLKNSPDIKFWSTFAHLNHLFGSHQLSVPYITNRETDDDFDSKFDRLDLNISIPINKTDEVIGVRLILFFEYKLETKIDFQIETIVNMEYHYPKAGNGLKIASNLVFNQNNAFIYRKRYRSSGLEALESQDFFIEDLIESYSTRNFSTSLCPNTYYDWKPKKEESKHFKVWTSIGYTEQLFQYRPGFWYLMKWAFVQYLSIFFVFYLIIDRIKAFVFENRLLDCIQTNPLIND